MRWIKTFESRFTESDKFKSWFKDSKMINPDGTPKVVYHGTSAKFKRIASKYSTMGGIIWFSSDIERIQSGDSGASGNNVIKQLYISMRKPAGWDEYGKYTLGQLKDMGYDGAILPDANRFDGFVFNSNQIRIAK